MRHHIGDVLQLGLGGELGVDQQQGLAVGDAARVLHGALREVGQRDHVDLLVGVGQPVVLAEEPQREHRGIQREAGEVALARHVNHPDRHAVDLERPR